MNRASRSLARLLILICSFAAINMVTNLSWATSPQRNEPSVERLLAVYLSDDSTETERFISQESLSARLFSQVRSPEYFKTLSTIQNFYEAHSPLHSQQEAKLTDLVFYLQDVWISHSINFLMNHKDDEVEYAMGATIAGGSLAAAVSIFLFRGSMRDMDSNAAKNIRKVATRWFRRTLHRYSRFARVALPTSIIGRAQSTQGSERSQGQVQAPQSAEPSTEPSADRLSDRLSQDPKITSLQDYYPSPLDVLNLGLLESEFDSPTNHEDFQAFTDAIALGGGLTGALLIEFGMASAANRTSLMAFQSGHRQLARTLRSVGRLLRAGGPVSILVGIVTWKELSERIERARNQSHLAEYIENHRRFKALVTGASTSYDFRRHSLRLVNHISEFTGFYTYPLLLEYGEAISHFERQAMCMALTQPAANLNHSELLRHPHYRSSEVYEDIMAQLDQELESALEASHQKNNPYLREAESWLSDSSHLFQRRPNLTNTLEARLQILRHGMRALNPSSLSEVVKTRVHTKVREIEAAISSRDWQRYELLAQSTAGCRLHPDFR